MISNSCVRFFQILHKIKYVRAPVSYHKPSKLTSRIRTIDVTRRSYLPWTITWLPTIVLYATWWKASLPIIYNKKITISASLHQDLFLFMEKLKAKYFFCYNFYSQKSSILKLSYCRKFWFIWILKVPKKFS